LWHNVHKNLHKIVGQNNFIESYVPENLHFFLTPLDIVNIWV
jgi:hypothetical protein